MNLFPHLPREVADQLSRELVQCGLSDATKLAAIDHPRATFRETGGTRVQEPFLRELQRDVRAVANEFGYPGARVSRSGQSFEARLGGLLHHRMDLSANESVADGLWSFMGCVLLPDIVRWRLPDTKDPNNFKAENRGIDHSIGRCWWWCDLLYDRGAPNPYHLVAELGIDELVGFTRKSAIVSRRTAVALAKSLIRVGSEFPRPRMDLSRSVMQHLRRIASIIVLEALDDDELDGVLAELVQGVGQALLAAD